MAKVGRPTKYKRKFCQEIVDFFDVEPYHEIEHRTTDPKSGRSFISYEDRGTDLPTIERFAHNIGVNPDTLVEWAKGRYPDSYEVEELRGELKHPEFSAAYLRAKALQKDLLITNGLHGLYPSNFAIFVASNLTDMRVKEERDVNVRTPQPILGGATVNPDGVPVNNSTPEDTQAP